MHLQVLKELPIREGKKRGFHSQKGNNTILSMRRKRWPREKLRNLFIWCYLIYIYICEIFNDKILMSYKLWIYCKNYFHNIFNYKRCNTPCAPATQFSKRNGNLLFDPSLHCSIVGALQYLTFTQPNISFGVNQFRNFVQARIDIHFKCKLAHRPLY